MNAVLAVLVGVLFAELLGYWLHRLMHSERIAWLSRNHMIHHLRDYSPLRSMRPSDSYARATAGRQNVGGVGLEWLIPIAVVLAITLALASLLGASALYLAVFALVSVTWGVLMFSYMHDSMHIRGFWMERARPLRRWYRRVRRQHDIHHMLLDASGRMNRNYGICFFWFDRLFRTFAERARRPDAATLAATMKRYEAVLGPVQQ